MNIPQVDTAKMVLGIGAAVILFAAGFGTCYQTIYLPEHDSCVREDQKVKDAGSAREDQTAGIDKTNTEATKDAQKARDAEIESIHQWYRSHPVVKWVRPESSCSEMSRSTEHPGQSERIPTGEHEQPGFTPEQCSYYANELKGLLDLLHRSPSVEFQSKK